MLIIEKYKEEIKNYDFKGEDISCFLARLSLHKKYDDQPNYIERVYRKACGNTIIYACEDLCKTKAFRQCSGL